MSQQDQRKWEQKWQEVSADAEYPPGPWLMAHAALLTGGLALDLACGRGQNTLWLAERGYWALGVDISAAALAAARAEAKKRGLVGRTAFVQADLDHWRPRPGVFDLVVVFRFLDRRLFAAIRQAVRPGGLVLYETRHTGILGRLPGSTPDYLLARGELAATFADWTIINNREGDEDAAIVARKPALSL
jgi:SAM-dependent methyltransferase